MDVVISYSFFFVCRCRGENGLQLARGFNALCDFERGRLLQYGEL
jgi:hypothetical protein